MARLGGQGSTGNCSMKSGDPSKSLGALTIARISSRKPRFHYTVAAMTHTEFLNMRTAVALPIVLADGRVGLCNHWTATEIVVDVYGDGSHAMETERVPFADVIARGAGLAVSLLDHRRGTRATV
jgi:hypothetical protein